MISGHTDVTAQCRRLRLSVQRQQHWSRDVHLRILCQGFEVRAPGERSVPTGSAAPGPVTAIPRTITPAPGPPDHVLGGAAATGWWHGLDPTLRSPDQPVVHAGSIQPGSWDPSPSSSRPRIEKWTRSPLGAVRHSISSSALVSEPRRTAALTRRSISRSRSLSQSWDWCADR